MLILYIICTVGAQQIVELKTKMTFFNGTNHEKLKTIQMTSLSMYQQKDKFEWNATISSNHTTFTINNTSGNITDNNNNTAYVALCYIEDTDGGNYKAFLEKCKNNETLTKSFNTT